MSSLYECISYSQGDTVKGSYYGTPFNGIILKREVLSIYRIGYLVQSETPIAAKGSNFSSNEFYIKVDIRQPNNNWHGIQAKV